MKFQTTIVESGKTATGIRVPDDIIASLGPSRRPPVRVTLNSYTYRTTVGTVNGSFMVSVSADVRKNAGVSGGDLVDVDIELDTEPREVSVPPDLQEALSAEPEASRFFDTLPFSHKSAYVVWVESAAKDETRQRRIPATVRMLKQGRKQR